MSEDQAVVASESVSEEVMSQSTNEFLTFRSGEEYGMDILKVQETTWL